jgi:hypothetical protein
MRVRFDKRQAGISWKSVSSYGAKRKPPCPRLCRYMGTHSRSPKRQGRPACGARAASKYMHPNGAMLP